MPPSVPVKTTGRASGNESWSSRYPRPPAVLDAATLRGAALLDLTVAPVSPASHALVDALLPPIIAAEARGNRRGVAGLAKLREALGAIVGGILHHWSGEHARPVFHPRQREAFSGGSIGHRQFAAAVDALASLGMIHTADSKRFANDYGFGTVSAGWAARYWPAASLLDLAESQGVTVGTARQDFAAVAAAISTVPPSVPDPIQLRALKPHRRRGQPAPLARPLPILPDDAVAAALADGVVAANAFAGGFDVRGTLPPRWRRSFVLDWRLGGRWTAVGGQNYQTASQARRLAVTIDGEAVIELDVHGCPARFLNMLRSLFVTVHCSMSVP